MIAITVIGFLISPTSSSKAGGATNPRATGVVTLPPGPSGQLALILREARQDIGLSQREISERSEIPASRISEFELGVAVPTDGELSALSQAYQLSRDEWTQLVMLQTEIRQQN